VKKTVLITGSSRGIGAAAAELYAAQGFNVFINYRHSKDAADQLTSRLEAQGAAVMAYQTDVSQHGPVQKMVAACHKRFGQIDVLINNAGIAQEKLFGDITEEEWDLMFNIHVKGAFNCCQAIVPEMIARKAGKIINVSSIWGITGGACEVHYSAAKAALIGFTKALAKELGPSNIQVNCVAPGIISTDMNAAMDDETKTRLIQETPLLRFGRPQEAAQAILFLGSEQADFITGQVLSPNGGYVI
jgi:3-oxoacyl-[acyl-carrier protein] reductase